MPVSDGEGSITPVEAPSKFSLAVRCGLGARQERCPQAMIVRWEFLLALRRPNTIIVQAPSRLVQYRTSPNPAPPTAIASGAVDATRCYTPFTESNAGYCRPAGLAFGCLGYERKSGAQPPEHCDGWVTVPSMV